MEISIVSSVFYLLTTALLCVGFLLWKKSEDKLHMATWLPVTFIGLMGYQTIVAGIIGLVKIPINIISIGMFNLIPGVAIWVAIMKRKEFQKYKIQLADLAMWIILVVSIVGFASIRYGENLTFAYNSLDAASHFTGAMDVMRNESIFSMYFAFLHNALLLEILGPLFTVTTYYKIFVLGDVLYLLLGGVAFWGLIKKYCEGNFMICAGLFTTMIYLFAYPLNSTLFGFSYLGLALTVIVYIIIVTDFYLEDKIGEKLGIALMSFGCVSIFQSYMLFMPVVFFSILFCILIKQHQNKKLVSLDTVVKGFGIFLIPTALGLWYAFGGIFGGANKENGVTVSSQIALEGGIYGDLFSNFIFLIPLVVFGWWMLVKNKKNILVKILLPLSVMFVAALFIMALSRKVSAYYYYKNYYMLWVLAVFVAFLGVYYMEKQTRLVVAAGAIMWAMLFLFGLRGWENYITDKNPLLHPRIKAAVVGDIYYFNRDFLRTARYSEGKIEIFKYVREEILDEELTDEVLIISYVEDQYWYDVITDQRLPKYSSGTVMENIQNKMVKYVVVLYDRSDYGVYQEELDAMEKTFENSDGFVIRVY